MYKIIVNRWLNNNKVSNELKQAILKMPEEERKRAFDLAPLAFGTAGIRNIMGPGTQYLNEFTYRQMALGYGLFLKKKYHNQRINIVVTHDNRNHGVLFTNTVVDALTSLGINVIMYDYNQLVATPIVSFTIREIGAHGAVIVTASHNPKEYNGFKVYNSTGGQISEEDGAEIVKYMQPADLILDLEVKPNDSLISFLDESIFEKYFKAMSQVLINTEPGTIKTEKIIFSGQHGTASKRLPEYLKRLGYANIIPVVEQCQYDGNFTYTKSPNPENRVAWDLSLKYADYHKSDVIVQVDPDADRFAIAVRHEGEWRFLTGNEMGIIYSFYMLKMKKLTKIPFIVSSYVSTNLIDRIIKKYGGVVYRTGTGFKLIGGKVNEIGERQDFIVGFEEAIGALNSLIGRDKDGFQAAALALEIFYHAKNFHHVDLIDFLEKIIYKEFGNIYNATVAFVFKELNWKELAKARMDKMLNFKETKIGDREIKEIKWNDVGGCIDWILDGDSWLRFRMSGTEPKFKVYYNLYGDSLDGLRKEAEQIQTQLKKILDL
ncbi:phospho-sugar mutase [[Mycoplasma] testudinis]|uniref:phospho-sugar mutase n=1 Tax=[Mycoplasma] testudinis TaxID=33924 RepID=UPI000482D60B|nr:phospho-sugar mutase [[Mycoplasma] testudinis]